jgi:fibronectin type 3 domain-containing protein
VAPSNLSANTVSSSEIDLSWTDNSDNELVFKIERSTDGGATFTEIATTGANVTTYADTGLTNATPYYYRVRASNSGGDSAYSNNASATLLPAAPSSLTASAVSSSEIDLFWADNSDNELVFKIERSSDGGATFTEIATTAANVTTYADTGLTNSSTYYYRVRASNASGDSAYSNTASATLPVIPAAPSNLSANTISSNEIDLFWADNSDNETEFKIERSTDAGITFTEIATVGANATAFPDAGLSPLTAYTYRVRASNLAGDSDYSNTATAITSP